MSRGQRIGLIVAAVAVAIVAFVVLRPGGEDEAPAPASAPATGGASPAASGGGRAGADRERERPRPEEPVATEIAVEDGGPVGGPAEIEVEKGDEVRMEVTSDAPEEVHVHGYELYEDLKPGKAARLSFPAELEGAYEVELHGSGAQLAELEVSP